LWDVAWKVKDRKERLDDVAAAAGSTAEDADVYEEIERRHRSFEEAQEQHERMRHLWFMVGGISAISAVPAAMLAGGIAAVPLILAAMATTAASIVSWRRAEDARLQEQDALAEAGATSYLTFQINRVNGLVASDQNRRQIMQAAEYHRAALVEWTLLGRRPADRAIEHRRGAPAAAASSIGGVRNRWPAPTAIENGADVAMPSGAGSTR
jgi:hypothetical protein